MRIEVVVAPNPGLMTGPGTNTWLVTSGGDVVVIDPGPVIDEHLDRVRAAVGDSSPVAVLVTHAHPDHAPSANDLAHEWGVPAIGRSGGEGFVPDRVVADGDEVRVGSATFVVVATPGHTADSTSYRVEDSLFTGDHIIGGSTVVVEDVTAYLASLRRLEGTGLERLYPGHGPVLDSPDETIRSYLDHRREREAMILDAVRSGAGTVDAVVADVYDDVDIRLHPVASVSVVAHLRKLAGEGLVEFDATAGRVRVGTTP
jgi:glyoxylase-like metal-dependent hydrolase (beta-lactamase superfamily II)